MDRDVTNRTKTATVEPSHDETPDTEAHSMSYARFLGSRQNTTESERQRLAKRAVDEALPPLTKRFPNLREPNRS